MVRDHPRSRGVYDHPQTRLLRRDWIIPARAGFTESRYRKRTGYGDHPRSRGVYAAAEASAACEAGSSPLARGLPRVFPSGARASGIIPARAGFTDRQLRRHRVHSDHPRSRGVYDPGPGVCRRGVGSSPLARGLHMVKRNGERDWGIIPARAGFTGTRPGRTASAGDHPRSRGVYLSRWLAGTRTVGSSPLARGLQTSLTCGRLPVRIIPARAGFTPPIVAPAWSMLDHPRSRGVYVITDRHLQALGGSSPLARGLRRLVSRLRRQLGIIPARAGFTYPSACQPRQSPDHPRSRGVYSSISHPKSNPAGSSPLARGLRARR